MTWSKYGTEFPDDCASAGLSDAAFRTHTEAIGWIYRVESMDMRIPKHLVRRFAGSDQWEVAVKDLVAAEFWRDDGDAYVVEHHRDVIRQSIAAQRNKRERDKRAQSAHRDRSRSVIPDSSDDVSAYTVSQTDTQEAGKEVSSAHTHAKPCDRCGAVPSRVNGAGARYCRACSPAIWKDVSA